MQKETLHPKESLSIIEEMIGIEKLQFAENGFITRLWGWTVVTAALMQFILLKTPWNSYHYLPWYFTIISGIITGIYYSRKKVQKSYPLSGKVLAFVWIAIGINIFGIAFIFPVKAGKLLLFIILSQIAVGTIATGALWKLNMLIGAAIFCILCGFISILVPYEYWTLLTMAAITATNLIPGYMLKVKNRS